MRRVWTTLGWVVASMTGAQAFDLQGHRGTRGYLPENTMPAFERALEIGVTTLETDLAMTRDGVLVLSHDPMLNPDVTRTADGQWLAVPGPAINTLSFAELQAYDVGRLNPASRYAGQWPEQKPRDGTRIPRLQDLFEVAARVPGLRLNIETKLSPLKPTEAPDPETFAQAVVVAIRGAKLADRVTVQSFDWRTLLAVKRLAPEIVTVCLTIDTPTNSTLRPIEGKPSPWLGGLDLAAQDGSISRLANAAGCGVWSPFWRNVDAASVTAAQGLGLKVIPWTVNLAADMAAAIELGVDGLITDYPDRARTVLQEKNITIAR